MLLFVHPYLRGFMSVGPPAPHARRRLVLPRDRLVQPGGRPERPGPGLHDRAFLQATAVVSITACSPTCGSSPTSGRPVPPEFIKAPSDRAAPGWAFRIVAWLVPSGRAATTRPIAGRGRRLPLVPGRHLLPVCLLLVLPALLRRQFGLPIRPNSPTRTRPRPAALHLRPAGRSSSAWPWRSSASGRGRRRDRRSPPGLPRSGARPARQILAQGVAGPCSSSRGLYVLLASSSATTSGSRRRSPPLHGVRGSSRLFAVICSTCATPPARSCPARPVGRYCDRPDYRLRFPHLEPEYAGHPRPGGSRGARVPLSECRETWTGRRRARGGRGVAKLVATHRDPAEPAPPAADLYADSCEGVHPAPRSTRSCTAGTTPS